jgi:hypothetical protein
MSKNLIIENIESPETPKKREKTGGRQKGTPHTLKKKLMLVYYDEDGLVMDTKLFSTMKELADQLGISTHRARYYYYQSIKEVKPKQYHSSITLSKFAIKKINC